MDHKCKPPEPTYGSDDWTCPDCGQSFFIDSNHCRECGHSPGPTWEKFGTGDGKFPLVTTKAGGITYGN